MKIRTTLLCLILGLCAASSFAKETATGVTVIDDNALRIDFEKKMAGLVEAGEATPYATLAEQLQRKSCKLDLPATGTKKLTPAEIYQQRINATLMLGRLHHCSSKKCVKTHANIASGVVIREDGVVLTNYHVAAGGDERSLGMGAMTCDGKAFVVEEVLAADEKADVAILKLKNAKGLSAAPIFRDEPVGGSCTIISNPVGDFFTLSQGYVARYYITEDKCVMNVTADYAKGSSGGPIFNDRGDLIGLVSNTVSIAYNQMPLCINEEDKALTPAKGVKPSIVNGRPLVMDMNHQMTIKNTVPSRSILGLIED